MNDEKWKNFEDAREKFSDFTKELSKTFPDVVYNNALDGVKHEDKIKLIIVADNPGQEEQKQGKYLVGDAGTIARNFFRDHKVYGISEDDFCKKIIVLNKTPIYTAYTGDLTKIKKLDMDAFNESLEKMACIFFEFHNALGVPVWITGFGQMKKGLFAKYTKKLGVLYADTPKLREDVYVFGHFSHGWFARDVNKALDAGENFTNQLELIGKNRRKDILGN